MSRTTLITALYDIGRDKLNGKSAYRSFNKYLNWFKYTLWINVPMVIFIPEYLQSYVQEHRPYGYPTQIIIRSFEELSAYKYHDRIQSTINNMNEEHGPGGFVPSYFKECPEFITAKYETIIFSKFDFLKEVATNNPFNTEYFIWLDAGTFYQEPPFNYNLDWPDPYKIRILGDKFLVSDHNFNINNKTPLSNKRSYLRLNRNEICAFILGGNKFAIDRVHTQFWNEVNNALDMGVINNEQHFLQLMALDHPDYYYCWYRTRYHYHNLPIPLRDRMIPSELAQGTYIGENYPINPNIKLLTIATKELFDSTFKRWEITAKHYGYDYEILGRDTVWKGFSTKIGIYCNALKNTTTPYVVLTDCLDLFITAPSDELYHKFISQNNDIIIGSEMMLWYPNGKNNSIDINNYFNSIKQSPQAYPNSGFIMGKTSEVLKLMTSHLSHFDDQAACIDTIYENKFPISIDYRTEFVGNIPDYHGKMDDSLSYFEYDSVLNRYKSKLHGTMPVMLHFPGKNKSSFLEYYTNTHSEFLSQENNVSNIGLILFIILIILIILLVAYSYY